MDQPSKDIVLDNYNIVLSCVNLSSSTVNKKIGRHEKDGCMGDVYLFQEGEDSWVTCGKWSASGCRLLHEVEKGQDVSTFEKLIAYAKSLQ